jgi:hypothetical protein
MKKYLIIMITIAFSIALLAGARFTDNGDGTIKDNATGLVWTKCTMKTVSEDPLMDTTANCTDTKGTGTWENALKACENLNHGGRTDWRLPNINELKSIADYSKYNPAINTVYFPGTASSNYWSSTTFVSYTGSAWYVVFYYGNTDHFSKTSNYYVRCVSGQ